MGAAEKTSISLHHEVGNRIKQRRKVLDISQARLAELLGSSYQQIQKYESGSSQLTLSKLLLFAQVLNVDPSYFYDGIPMDALEDAPEEPDVIRRRSGKPLSVLLVEDSPADALLFSKASASFGEDITLECLNDPEQLMDMLCRHAQQPDKGYDLVVLDLSLPKIGGLALLKNIKANSQTAAIPVLILTNSISRREMVEAYRLGAAGFIQKSIHLDEYRTSIETMVRYWLKVVALPTV